MLPNTTQAERLDLVFSWAQMYLTLNMPAVAPLGEALSNREMIARLATRIGFEDPTRTRRTPRAASRRLPADDDLAEGARVHELDARQRRTANCG